MENSETHFGAAMDFRVLECPKAIDMIIPITVQKVRCDEVDINHVTVRFRRYCWQFLVGSPWLTSATVPTYLQETYHLGKPPQSAHPASQFEANIALDLEYSINDAMPTPVPLDAEEFFPKNETGQVRRLSEYGSNLGPEQT